jgi:hypothetical protein
MAEQTRARMAQDYGIDLSDRSDAEVIDSLKYNVFPNSIIYGSPTLPLIQQFRPLGMDPDKCTLDMLIFRPVKPGEEAPLPADPVTISEDDSYCDVPGMDPFLGAVLDQDTAIMRWQNEGMHASHKAAETLSSYQEARIRRLHETLDKYVNRPERTAAGGHAGAT